MRHQQPDKEEVIAAAGCGLLALFIGILLNLLWWGAIICLAVWAIKSIFHV